MERVLSLWRFRVQDWPLFPIQNSHRGSWGWVVREELWHAHWNRDREVTLNNWKWFYLGCKITHVLYLLAPEGESSCGGEFSSWLYVLPRRLKCLLAKAFCTLSDSRYRYLKSWLSRDVLCTDFCRQLLEGESQDHWRWVYSEIHGGA